MSVQKLLLGVWFLLGPWAWVAPAAAEPPVAQQVAAPKAEVTLQVVHASQGSVVEPGLQGLAKQFAHTRYTGFRLLDTQKVTVATGGEASFSFLERRLKAIIKERRGEDITVHLQLFNREQAKYLDTTVTLKKGKAFPVYGPKHQEGVLILLITVS